jgi:GDP-L-fucose synthase
MISIWLTRNKRWRRRATKCFGEALRMDKTARIFVAGHRGMVGAAICRRLTQAGYHNLILRTRKEVDLRDAAAVKCLFRAERPEYVFLAAARVGGILANSTQPAEFIFDNLSIQTNVIDAAYRAGVAKLQFLGSSCIYPKLAPQPLKEEYLLTGSLEPTNEWYAIAKIAGIKMTQAYCRQYGFCAINLMPTNLYGPEDNFDLNSSHVMPALIRKFHEAAREGSSHVVIWGSGSPRREFLHVDDLADAALFLMLNYDQPEIVNVGSGEDCTIRDLAKMIAHAAGFSGELCFDTGLPDGTPRKLLDVSRLNTLGWKPRIPLSEGIRTTYEWYQAQSRYSRAH